ncbi:MAG: hypothetical protein QF473_28505, partial [Planctomycetota bacterium]|nr:hypothetical protein [Planctomycetota bacterium]
KLDAADDKLEEAGDARDEAKADVEAAQQDVTEAAETVDEAVEAEKQQALAEQKAAEEAARQAEIERQRRIKAQQAADAAAARAAERGATTSSGTKPPPKRPSTTTVIDQDITIEQPTRFTFGDRPVNAQDVQNAVGLALLGEKGENAANTDNLAIKTGAQAAAGSRALEAVSEVAFVVAKTSVVKGIAAIKELGGVAEGLANIIEAADSQASKQTFRAGKDYLNALAQGLDEEGIQVHSTTFEGRAFTLTTTTYYNTETGDYTTVYVREPKKGVGFGRSMAVNLGGDVNQVDKTTTGVVQGNVDIKAKAALDRIRDALFDIFF